MAVTTAADRKQQKAAHQQRVDSIVAGGEKKKLAKDNPGGRKTIKGYRKRRTYLTHRTELKPEQLQPMIDFVNENYPWVRFNQPDSQERVMAHYVADDKNHEEILGWYFMLTTSAQKFYMNPATGEIFEGQGNTI